MVYPPQGAGQAGGAVIKSVQRGTAQITGGNASLNVTITAVDLSKSFVIAYRTRNTNVGTQEVRDHYMSADLTSPTNVRFQRGDVDITHDVAWEVIEFASGVTVQKVSSAPSAGVTITAVDLDKTFLIGSNWSIDIGTSIGAVANNVARMRLSNSNTLVIEGDSDITAVVFVVEVS